MGGGLWAIDYCASHLDGSFHSYATAVIEDHPFLQGLPKNAPRAVRHPYRAGVRLKYLFATEGWDLMQDMNRAEEARSQYNSAVSCS